MSRHWAIGLRTGETRRVSGPELFKFPVFSTHSFIHVEPNPQSRLHLTESEEGEEFVYRVLHRTRRAYDKLRRALDVSPGPPRRTGGRSRSI